VTPQWARADGEMDSPTHPLQVRVTPQLLHGLDLSQSPEEATERPAGAILRYGELCRHLLLRYKAVAVALHRAANRFSDSDKPYVVVNPDKGAWVWEACEVMRPAACCWGWIHFGGRISAVVCERLGSFAWRVGWPC